ncbi:MAG: PqqD family peptide modification chaperone [Chloroflexota bacterium]
MTETLTSQAIDPAASDGRVPIRTRAAQRKPLRSVDVLEQPLDDDLVIFSPEDGAGQILNSTAARIWKLCDGTHTVLGIAREIARTYGLPAKDVREDVETIVAQFREQGLIDRSVRKPRTRVLSNSEERPFGGLPIRESQLQRDGLAIGSVAPEFTLPDLDENPRTLSELRAGREAVIVFSDPQCGPCMALWPTLVQCQPELLRNNVTLAIVSRGELEANRAKAQEFGASFPILRQMHWEISLEYATFETPVAYHLDAQGIVTRNVSVGGPEIEKLLNDIVGDAWAS